MPMAEAAKVSAADEAAAVAELRRTGLDGPRGHRLRARRSSM